MSNTFPSWMRKITTFDQFFACSICHSAIRDHINMRHVARWHCDTCKKSYLPFFDDLLVADYPDNWENCDRVF